MTRAAAALTFTLLAAPAFAQSVDPAFDGQWTWSPAILASEATGLGGAFVAVVRGADALYWSPAAMTFDAGIDVRVSIGARPGVGVVYHGESLHAGFGMRRTFSRTEHGRGFDASNDVFEMGQLGAMVDQVAAGAAMRAGRLRFGASLAAGPLQATGAWSRVTSSGRPTELPTEVRYDYTDADEWQIGSAASAIVDILGTHAMARDQARIGVALQWPTMIRTPHYRRSRIVLPSFEGSGPDLQRLRLPATVSVGGEAKMSAFSMVRSVRVAFGADWADYGGVLDTARDNAPGDDRPLAFDQDRTWSFGGGVEASFPWVRIRVGARERADHALVVTVPRRRANTPRATFGASRDAVIAGKRLQLDADSTSSFNDVVISLRLLW